jgi:hypothetical protein
MGLSSRIFLLSADDTLHTLANAAFMRMLRQEAVARIPDFAGQRVRQASVVVEVLNGAPSRTVYCTFAMLDIDADGTLDVDRLSAQQVARMDDLLAHSQPTPATSGSIIDAASRFVARGGSWEPDQTVLRRIESAALGKLACPRVRVVR